jgi:hypothetical protein
MIMDRPEVVNAKLTQDKALPVTRFVAPSDVEGTEEEICRISLRKRANKKLDN